MADHGSTAESFMTRAAPSEAVWPARQFSNMSTVVRLGEPTSPSGGGAATNYQRNPDLLLAPPLTLS